MSPQRRSPGKAADSSLERVRLTASVTWWAKAGTSVRWYWEDERKGTWATGKPFWEMTRKGFEVREIEEAIEALRGSAVTVDQLVRHARQQDSA